MLKPSSKAKVIMKKWYNKLRCKRRYIKMQDHLQYLSILEEQPEKNILKEIRLSAKDNCRKLHTLVKQKARSSAKM